MRVASLPILVVPFLAMACSSPPIAPPTNQSAHQGHAAGPEVTPPRTRLLGNLGKYSRPIKTDNAEAQLWFDEGLNLLYGFNHEESFRSFQGTAMRDPKSPMPHWGMALALGTNINDPAPEDRIQKAVVHLGEAQKLAANGSPAEQALVAALALRYTGTPETPAGAALEFTARQAAREQAYATAMGAASKTFPGDLDIATLWAESLMNLRPWRLYTRDGKPEPGTETIVATLERVMKANPNHPGANHYYIHAVEASTTPNRGVAAAGRLETLVPGAGHLVHMPAHIYMRTGEYARSAKSNALAAAVDQRYVASTGATGFYPVMYYGHNLQFESAASMFAGNLKQARIAAQLTVRLVDPVANDMPMVEHFAQQEAFVLVRFGQWGDVLAMKPPAPSRAIQTALHWYARGAALAGQRKPDEAQKAQAAFTAAVGRVPKEIMISPGNSVHAMLQVAAHDLDGRIAMARGDANAAADAFAKGVAAEDALSYNEPPDWLLPVRERLGAALLASARPADAEKVFRQELLRNVGNPRALFGVWQSLEAQKRTAEAAVAQKHFEDAWRGADVTLGQNLEVGSSR